MSRPNPAPASAPVTAPAPCADPLTLLPLLSIGAFASQASIRLADPMLPQLALEFGTRIADLAGVITAFAMAYGLMQLFYGPMADRIGKLRVIAWATGVASLGSAACGFAIGPDSLAVLRLLTGAACASLIPLTLAWIGDSVPYAQRQPVLARFMIGSTLGIIFGQVAGGVFADTIGWRLSFVAPALVFGAVALVLARGLRSGAIISGAATAPPGDDSPTAAGALRNPLAAFGLVLRSAWARTVLALTFIEGALNFGTLALLPAWLHTEHGLSLWQTGLAAAGYGVGGLSYALLGPWLLSRLGEKGLALSGAALLCTGLMSIGSPHWLLEAAKCTMAGAGFFMMHSTFQTVATQMVPHLRGTAISAFALALFVGQSGGVALVAYLSHEIGFEAVKQVNALGLLLLGALFSSLLWRRARTAPQGLN